MEVIALSRNRKGETACGDATVDVEEGGVRLFAVVDGLGHGEGACEAATRAVGIIRQNAASDVQAIMERLHAGLHGTRGAVASLLRFEPAACRVEYIGLGNIDIRSTNRAIKPVSWSGILGHNWRRPTRFAYTYEPGDVFVMFSDGVSGRFDLDEHKAKKCRDIAQDLMASHGKDHDDATILVIRA